MANRTRGLSPPVRGSLFSPSWGQFRPRSIPARAGEPSPPAPPSCSQRVYPRPCGGADRARSVRASARGLSPPVRGSRHRAPGPTRPARSIPARAGEPYPTIAGSIQSRVYPRPCGGAPWTTRARRSPYGLSPPVRGSRLHAVLKLVERRSIPARAGEPAFLMPPIVLHPVYPRPCGGACHTSNRRRQLQAVYPRPCGGAIDGLRGSMVSMIQISGSIPARAGEPLPTRPEVPRGLSPPVPTAAGWGLSPPVRGSHDGFMAVYALRGSPYSFSNERQKSIPARAGEPATSCRSLIVATVYPRPCGGASCDTDITVASCGGLGQLRTHFDLEGQVLIGSRYVPDKEHPVRVPYLFRRIAQVPQAEAAGDGTVPANHRYRPVSEGVKPA